MFQWMLQWQRTTKICGDNGLTIFNTIALQSLWHRRAGIGGKCDCDVIVCLPGLWKGTIVQWVQCHLSACSVLLSRPIQVQIARLHLRSCPLLVPWWRRYLVALPLSKSRLLVNFSFPRTNVSFYWPSSYSLPNAFDFSKNLLCTLDTLEAAAQFLYILQLGCLTFLWRAWTSSVYVHMFSDGKSSAHLCMLPTGGSWSVCCFHPENV